MFYCNYLALRHFRLDPTPYWTTNTIDPDAYLWCLESQTSLIIFKLNKIPGKYIAFAILNRTFTPRCNQWITCVVKVMFMSQTQSNIHDWIKVQL